jgi:sterol O-acyltransferase
MATFTLNTFIKNWQETGSIMSLRLFDVFTIDLGGLFATDVMMILSMTPIWWFHWIVARGWIPRPVELVMQHAFQTTFLFVAVWWTLQRNWPWVQSGVFMMHTVAMLMKIHSYAARNSNFHQLDLKSKKLAKAIADKKKADEDAEEIQQQLMLVEETLMPGSVRYPHNLTLSNWVDYLCVPTLVYELHYPRTTEIRYWYVVEKIAAILGTITLLYMTIEHYIVPTMQTADQNSFFTMLPQLLFPFLIAYLMMFYIIFEGICNAVAELTRFADRAFYDDWWNSITWDEFARKWNKPVHHFLLREVYFPLRQTLKLPKFHANLATFLLSAFIHELVIAVAVKQVRMYFFVMQMLQLPLIAIGERIGKWGMETFGNWFFWIGMMVGPALLTYVYTWEHFVVAH